MSRFLIDLHSTHHITSGQRSFLSLEVMSRLGTVQSIVFRQSSGSDLSDEPSEEEREESLDSHDDSSIDHYDV